MKINRQQNLVIEVDGDNGVITFHSSPIDRLTFKKYHLVLSKTFAQIYQEGLTSIAGVRVAAMVLETVSKELPRGMGGNWFDGPDGVQNGLMNEIKRLTTVMIQDAGQWKSFPVHIALAQGLITEDDWYEAEGEIVFFILASAMHSRTDLPGILMGMTALWGGLITSSNATEYANSLQTSTVEKNTPIQTSSLPS